MLLANNQKQASPTAISPIVKSVSIYQLFYNVLILTITITRIHIDNRHVIVTSNNFSNGLMLLFTGVIKLYSARTNLPVVFFF